MEDYMGKFLRWTEDVKRITERIEASLADKH